MSLNSTITFLLAALSGPLKQTGTTSAEFRSVSLPNDTFSNLHPQPDIAAACYDFTKQLDLRTFTNFNSCIAAANATYGIRQGNVYDAPLTNNLALVGVNSSDGSKELADRVMTAAGDLTLFFCNVTGCNRGKDEDATDGVDDNATCGFAELFPNYASSGGEAENQRLMMNNDAKDVCRDRICDAVATRVSNDPDIGGIGVFISYFMQVGIALVILACLVMHNMPVRSNKRAFSLARKYTMFNSKRWVKPSEEFINFGFNFHKAQVWFLAVLMIASYIRRATEDISIVNSYMLLNIALNGVGLLSFTLMMLALLQRDKVDCFVMYMTSLCYSLCMAFMVYIMVASRTETEDWLDAAKFCDGRIVPTLVPRRRWDAINRYIDANRGLHRRYYVVVMVFCTLVLIFTEFLVRLRWNVKKYYDSGHKLITLSIGAFVAIGYTLVFFMQLWLMGLFTQLASVIWQNQWGFGQIVAVTLWVPIIADYFWDKFQKEKDHLRHLRPPIWADKLGIVELLRNERDSRADSSATDNKDLKADVEEEEQPQGKPGVDEREIEEGKAGGAKKGNTRNEDEGSVSK